jgi:hypothetical protein
MNVFYDAARRREEFQNHQRDFIWIEISLGLTFLDVAATTYKAETRSRNRINAQKAHDEAARRMERHPYATEDERHAAEAVLLVLTQRLEAYP